MYQHNNSSWLGVCLLSLEGCRNGRGWTLWWWLQTRLAPPDGSGMLSFLRFIRVVDCFCKKRQRSPRVLPTSYEHTNDGIVRQFFVRYKLLFFPLPAHKWFDFVFFSHHFCTLFSFFVTSLAALPPFIFPSKKTLFLRLLSFCINSSQKPNHTPPNAEWAPAGTIRMGRSSQKEPAKSYRPGWKDRRVNVSKQRPSNKPVILF